MSFFKTKTSWTNLELAIFKISIASVTLLIGIYFHAFFKNYILPIAMVSVLTSIWIVYLWFKKMKE